MDSGLFLDLFLKQLFSSSDTKGSSDTIFLLVRAILFLIFLFSESKGYIFFLKFLSSETFFGFILSKYALSYFLYNLIQ